MKYLAAVFALCLTACADLPPARPMPRLESHPAPSPSPIPAPTESTIEAPAPTTNPAIGVRTHILEAPAEELGTITIQEISRRRNFFRIDVGTAHGLQMSDRFQVLDPTLGIIADAEIVALRPLSAFLRVKTGSKAKSPLRVGQQVRRLAQENR